MSGSLHPMDCSLPGSSVHGILQARYWTRLPFPSPGDGSNPRTELVSLTSPALAGKFFTTVSPGKSPSQGWDKLMYWKDTWRSLSVIPALVSLPRSSFFFFFFFFFISFQKAQWNFKIFFYRMTFHFLTYPLLPLQGLSSLCIGEVIQNFDQMKQRIEVIKQVGRCNWMIMMAVVYIWPAGFFYVSCKGCEVLWIICNTWN